LVLGKDDEAVVKAKASHEKAREPRTAKEWAEFKKTMEMLGVMFGGYARSREMRYLLVVAMLLALVAVTMQATPASAGYYRYYPKWCSWSAASVCKKQSVRRKVPCGNGRYCEQ
jgi:hypothetical protein